MTASIPRPGRAEQTQPSGYTPQRGAGHRPPHPDHQEDRIVIRLVDRWRRKAKVEIACPHGAFVPGVARPGDPGGRYSCPDCPMSVRITWFRGPVNW